MKKVILGACLMIACSIMAKAQDKDFNDINKYMLLKKYSDAKPLVDKAETDPKMNTKPELYAIKMELYGFLAKGAESTPADAAAYRSTATAAFEKYKTLDPTEKLLPEHVNGLLQLYLSYYAEGIAKFNAKDWPASHGNFVNMLNISDLLIPKKLLNTSFDTLTTFYAGATAQNAKKDDDAVIYYTKLVDRKIAGQDYIVAYQFLTQYYMGKKDEANFQKYDELGKTMYPNESWFKDIQGDYVRQSGDFNKIVAYNESKIAANPNDYNLVYDLGADIYNYLNPRDTSKAPKGDVSEMENKMVGAFTKASQIKPEMGMPYAVLGSFYVNKAAQAGVESKKVDAAMKSANVGIKPDKNGKLPPIPKELITKKAEYLKKYDAYEDTAIIYCGKAADAFDKQAKLEPIEKQNYKMSVNFLIDLNDEKKGNSKVPADVAKYAAESKKWNAVYDKIK